MVSVIVPNYNHGKFLKERLDSVLRQTHKDIEIIVLDDASTDNSMEIIEKYAEIDARIKVYQNRENSGSPFVQWNRGVNLASGKYVWIAESDDMAHHTFLENLVPVLDRNGKIGLAYSQSIVVGRNGEEISDNLNWTDDLDGERWKSDFVNSGRDENVNYLIFKNSIPNASAVVFRRDLFLQVGGAPSNFRFLGDWMTWVKLLNYSNIYYTAKRLNYFRSHEGVSRRHYTLKSYLMRIAEEYAVVAYIDWTNDVKKGTLMQVHRNIFDKVAKRGGHRLFKLKYLLILLLNVKYDYRIIFRLLSFGFKIIRRKYRSILGWANLSI